MLIRATKRCDHPMLPYNRLHVPSASRQAHLLFTTKQHQRHHAAMTSVTSDATAARCRLMLYSCSQCQQQQQQQQHRATDRPATLRRISWVFGQAEIWEVGF